MNTPNPTRTYSAGSSLMQEPTDWERQQILDKTNLNSREQDKQQAFRAGLPMDTANPTRTYSASSSLSQAYGLNQMYGPAEDAYATQRGFDNAGITTRERDFLGPSPLRNPNRTYSADASLGALMQLNGPAEDAYARQKTHDDENLTLKEKGHQITRTVPVPDIEINPNRAYSADEPSNALWRVGNASF